MNLEPGKRRPIPLGLFFSVFKGHNDSLQEIG
jgi:hypothetical protein